MDENEVKRLKKAKIDKAVEILTNIGQTDAYVETLVLSREAHKTVSEGLSYAIELASEARQVKASQQFASATVKDVSKHIKGLEEIGDKAQAIALELRLYHKAIDEYVDAVTSAFRSGDLQLAALQRQEVLRLFGDADRAMTHRDLAPFNILNLLQVGEGRDG